MKTELITSTLLVVLLIFVKGETNPQNEVSSVASVNKYVSTSMVQSTSASVQSSSAPTTNMPTTPKPNPKIDCQKFNDCDSCIGYSNYCFFCEESKRCYYYEVKTLIPGEQCKSYKNMEFFTCMMSFQSLMILFGVLGGIVIVSFACLCCYCCCCRGKKNPLARDEARWAREREERKTRAEERRKERQSRTDEIRRKYGLIKGDNPYQKFDA